MISKTKKTAFHIIAIIIIMNISHTSRCTLWCDKQNYHIQIIIIISFVSCEKYNTRKRFNSILNVINFFAQCSGNKYFINRY